MTISAVEFLERCELDRKTLEVWMLEEWLVPVAAEPALGFCEADLARVALIRDLTDDLGVNAEGVGIILNLVDQLHNLRRALAETLSSAQLDG